MLYSLLKVLGRLALPLFFRKIIISSPAQLDARGPLLIACNHPNSFLDAILLDLLFKRPIWSLARGDVFKSAGIRKLLRALHILPVYRTSEGVENLNENYQTFNECIRLFENNSLVLIFSEGKCVNEWHLRPLKKGTARLAFSSWDKQIPLRVLPTGINYSSFRHFGKTAVIKFGNSFGVGAMDLNTSDGARNKQFNAHLNAELSELVIELSSDDYYGKRLHFHQEPSTLSKILLAIPAIAGWILHAPLYYPLSRWLWKKLGKTDHYDSLLFGALLFSYPFYLIILSWLAVAITDSAFALLLMIIAPLLARATTFLYRPRNHYSRHVEN